MVASGTAPHHSAGRWVRLLAALLQALAVAALPLGITAGVLGTPPAVCLPQLLAQVLHGGSVTPAVAPRPPPLSTDGMGGGDEPDLRGLWAYVEGQFTLGPYSLHGPSHWRRVEKNGLLLAPRAGADVRVVRLFAVLHDARRLDEGTDTGHGQRGAELAEQLRRKQFDIDDEAYQKLYYACAWHEKGRVTGEPTIGACWDADRLDLPRVGARPLPKYMSTAYGKELAAGQR